jgi:hypothetical protein
MEGTQCGNASPDGPNHGIEPEGLRNHQANTGTGYRLTDPSRLVKADRHRFLQKDVFPMKCGFFTYLQVEDRGKGHYDSIYGFIG